MKAIVASVVLAAATSAIAQKAIECKPDGGSKDTAWPGIYLSKTGQLCFDVLGWVDYRGQNCAKNGESIQWRGTVIVSVKGESQGRDLTLFRVQRPVVTDDRIDYAIEWSRDSKWTLMEKLSINPVTGKGTRYFVDEHGGQPLTCRSVPKKI